ncbi:hypothetical protein [Motiliproteus sp. MSK22-1]|uniref:hypothetical protein n=1 Tax=Motiliproteus sp. MSK22-1 TaxID=1897630 RepID=UPI0009782F83|nr:hypothetical protein [Motiliproteus sp. MSK22-1]OMH36161.1 hypothetical protein BGP75_10445 [Motiliproteus sp. MSK22-1]
MHEFRLLVGNSIKREQTVKASKALGEKLNQSIAKISRVSEESAVSAKKIDTATADLAQRVMSQQNQVAQFNR